MFSAAWILALTAGGARAQEDGPEVLAAVRVHGNHTIPAEEVLRLAGLKPGDRLPPLELIESRLVATGKFETVELRKRYRSLSGDGGVHLILVVKERVPLKRKLSFLPIIRFEDEYGLTFGGRISIVELPGPEDRVSFPLSWGARKVAAVEGRFVLPYLDRLDLDAGISQRENPHFELRDRRGELGAALTKRLSPFQLAVKAGFTNVRFGEQEDEFLTFGAGFRFDTRQERTLPRNAVSAGIDWERLAIRGGDRFDRLDVNLSGFVGLGRAVLAGNLLHRRADGRLPDYQRFLLGGGATLRGYPGGAFIGDNLVSGAIELRVPFRPFGNRRGLGQAGWLLFFDSGTVYDYGQRLSAAEFHQGAGLGGFLSILGLALKLELAHDLRGNFRVHFNTGFRF